MYSEQYAKIVLEANGNGGDIQFQGNRVAILAGISVIIVAYAKESGIPVHDLVELIEESIDSGLCKDITEVENE